MLWTIIVILLVLWRWGSLFTSAARSSTSCW
jgi:hypothetical protein